MSDFLKDVGRVLLRIDRENRYFGVGCAAQRVQSMVERLAIAASAAGGQ